MTSIQETLNTVMIGQQQQGVAGAPFGAGPSVSPDNGPATAAASVSKPPGTGGLVRGLALDADAVSTPSTSPAAASPVVLPPPSSTTVAGSVARVAASATLNHAAKPFEPKFVPTPSVVVGEGADVTVGTPAAGGAIAGSPNSAVKKNRRGVNANAAAASQQQQMAAAAAAMAPFLSGAAFPYGMPTTTTPIHPAALAAATAGAASFNPAMFSAMLAQRAAAATSAATPTGAATVSVGGGTPGGAGASAASAPTPTGRKAAAAAAAQQQHQQQQQLMAAMTVMMQQQQQAQMLQQQAQMAAVQAAARTAAEHMPNASPAAIAQLAAAAAAAAVAAAPPSAMMPQMNFAAAAAAAAAAAQTPMAHTPAGNRRGGAPGGSSVVTVGGGDAGGTTGGAGGGGLGSPTPQGGVASSAATANSLLHAQHALAGGLNPMSPLANLLAAGLAAPAPPAAVQVNVGNASLAALRQPPKFACVLVFGLPRVGTTTLGRQVVNRLQSDGLKWEFFSGGEHMLPESATERPLPFENTRNIFSALNDMITRQVKLQSTEPIRGLVIDKHFRGIEDLYYLAGLLRSHGLHLNGVVGLEVGDEEKFLAQVRERGDIKTAVDEENFRERLRYRRSLIANIKDVAKHINVWHSVDATTPMDELVVKMRSVVLGCSAVVPQKQLVPSMYHDSAASIVDDYATFSSTMEAFTPLVRTNRRGQFPCVAPRPLSAPTLLDRRVLWREFYVRRKSDGAKCVLFYDGKHMYLIPRHMRCVFLMPETAWQGVNLSQVGRFVLEGELTRTKERTREKFLVHDVLFWSDPDNAILNNVARAPWRERHEQLTQKLCIENATYNDQRPIIIVHQLSVPFTKAALLFDTCDYASEGIVLQPMSATPGRHEALLWRAPEMVTVDFRLGRLISEDQATHQRRFALEAFDDALKRYVEYRGHTATVKAYRPTALPGAIVVCCLDPTLTANTDSIRDAAAGANGPIAHHAAAAAAAVAAAAAAANGGTPTTASPAGVMPVAPQAVKGATLLSTPVNWSFVRTRYDVASAATVQQVDEILRDCLLPASRIQAFLGVGAPGAAAVGAIDAGMAAAAAAAATTNLSPSTPLPAVPRLMAGPPTASSPQRAQPQQQHSTSTGYPQQQQQAQQQQSYDGSNSPTYASMARGGPLPAGPAGASIAADAPSSSPSSELAKRVLESTGASAWGARGMPPGAPPPTLRSPPGAASFDPASMSPNPPKLPGPNFPGVAAAKAALAAATAAAPAKATTPIPPAALTPAVAAGSTPITASVAPTATATTGGAAPPQGANRRQKGGAAGAPAEGGRGGAKKQQPAQPAAAGAAPQRGGRPPKVAATGAAEGADAAPAPKAANARREKKATPAPTGGAAAAATTALPGAKPPATTVPTAAALKKLAAGAPGATAGGASGSMEARGIAAAATRGDGDSAASDSGASDGAAGKKRKSRRRRGGKGRGAKPADATTGAAGPAGSASASVSTLAPAGNTSASVEAVPAA